ncbi:MAG: class I SAM-dependent methyltransferase [Actinobacteria bacterium]|nr:class I SAM-dependent methyltransferase [Actinomycetota bacterium]
MRECLCVATPPPSGFCPVCGHRGEWGPVGPTTAREGLLCLGCGCTSRQRAIARAVLFVLDELTAADCLDRVRWDDLPRWRTYEVGHSRLTKRFAWLFSHDVSEYHDCGRGEMVQNLQQLTLPDESYRLVICSDVLEHVRLYRLALVEMVRVLRPGGALLITVPEISGPEHLSFCRIADCRYPARDEWDPDAPVHSDPLDPAGCRVYRTFSAPSLDLDLTGGFSLTVERTPAEIPECGIVHCPVIIARNRAS